MPSELPIDLASLGICHPKPVDGFPEGVDPLAYGLEEVGLGWCLWLLELRNRNQFNVTDLGTLASDAARIFDAFACGAKPFDQVHGNGTDFGERSAGQCSHDSL